ncbi:MAG: hypothetical protein M3R17_21305 [Bacteroidota bacterium]|nr:hypothetical protein [Bacteroidota bacterium]
MKDVNLNLNLNDVNTVLRALSALPYSQVNVLIERIQQQAKAQLGQTNGMPSVADAEKEVNNN